MPMYKKQLFVLIIILLAAIGGTYYGLYSEEQSAVLESSPPAENALPVKEITIYVTGAVNKPGLVKVAEGARAADAINACGGLLPIADSDYRCDQAADPNSVCAWNPDMYGLKADLPAAQAYYDSIFRLYAAWGVDYVKCDDIAREYPRCQREIEIISAACRHCGRDMVLSLSPGPAPLEHAEHLKKYANLWRITDDFWDEWRLLAAMFERAEKWCLHAGPGHWPDADMLPVGALRQCCEKGDWTHFTQAEQRTMMTLWCMLRSPLMIGGDLPKNDEFTLKLLTNQAVLDIEKTSWCAHPLYTTAEECAWIAPRRDGQGAYAAVFNLTDAPREVSLQVEYPFAQATELWTGKSYTELKACLPAHDAALWRIE